MARVLAVDDDAAGLEVRKLILECGGHVVATAADAEQARAAFAETSPEIVILDLRLPEVDDGLALLREFGATGVRLVVLSGWPADLDGRPERAMVHAVLLKPVRSEAMIRTCFQSSS